ncbi:tape measure protein [Sutcliffiella sp. FSL R7-0096]|uniref:tape measure protein n=1 Tax=Sutcliffiella sp. FSL R7-0096 TaxID=2921670 RepID=UPI003159EA6D
MADGRIKIDIEVDGKQVSVASKELDKLEKTSLDSSKGVKAAEKAMDNISDSSVEASKSVKGVSNSLDQVSSEASEAANDLNKAKNETKGIADESDKASDRTKKFAVAIGLIAIASAAFGVLKSSMDDAISRFDTLNKFPKVLQALGVSAKDSERAMSRLSEGIDGLPTKLDEIALIAQRMYTSFNDMDLATESALALNNALLGSGSSAVDAKRGTDQYIKALQTGKMDMNMWTTLQETMSVGLVKIAEGFGMTETEMYQALQSGTISMDQFNAKLIEVGTGTGIMAKLAKDNSLGIATSLGNLRNAAARGVAGMIDSFNKLSRDATGKEIAENIDGLKVIVNQSFKVIQKTIEGTTPYVKGFTSAVQSTLPVVKFLSPALIGLASAYAMHKVIHLTTAAIKANTTAVAVGTTVKKLYILAITESSTGYLVNAASAKVATVATKARSAVLVTATTVELLFTRQITLANVALYAKAVAVGVVGKALKVLMGPVGWVTLGIGALVGAAVGLIKWLNRSSEEAKRLNAEAEDLSSSIDSLNDELDSSNEAFRKNQNELKATAEENVNLAKKVEDLAAKENKSAAEKQLLSAYIEEMNGNVKDLNLSFDEEANALSMSSEELSARVDLMKEEEKLISARERQVEISKEQNEVDAKLEEINALRAEWSEKVKENAVSAGDAEKAFASLDEKEAALKETNAKLGEQHKETEILVSEAADGMAAAIEEGNIRQQFSYEALEGANKAAFDSMKDSYESLKDAATDAFDKIETKTDHTMKSMTETMLHNQKAVEEWSQNQAKLMKWAGENGYDSFIPYIESMGIDSAAELAVLAQAGEDELKNFADAVEGGAVTATDALKTTLGDGFDESIALVTGYVDDMSVSMKDQVKKSDFASIGKDVATGFSGGVVAGTPEAEKAAANMAKATEEAARKQAETRSPSRVFKRIGNDITAGLALGINDGTSQVTQAIQKLFKSIQTDSELSFKSITKNHHNSVKDIEKSFDNLKVVTQTGMKNMLDRLRDGSNRQKDVVRGLARDMLSPFNNTPSQFHSIGRNSMAGLNQGLLAGRGQVLSTARTIANQVASTMKSALRIHSPSRLMRDDVGRFIPEGIAVGIKENAKSVYRELDILSKNMVLSSTPEQALGTSRMAYASSSSQVMDPFKRVPLPGNNTSNSNMNLTGLISAIERLAARPIRVGIDGHEFIEATVDGMDAALQFKQARKDLF